MNRLLAFLLLFGAILGLLGQETAFAQMTLKPVTSEVSQMDPDCAKSMGIAEQPSSGSQPCQGMTPECIAKMGCIAPFALLPTTLVEASVPLIPASPALIPVPSLYGLIVAPDPEPPGRHI